MGTLANQTLILVAQMFVQCLDKHWVDRGLTPADLRCDFLFGPNLSNGLRTTKEQRVRLNVLNRGCRFLWPVHWTFDSGNRLWAFPFKDFF